jgi:4-amino-4-deoxy-L-arabinose transferase-like glycosyltransferase
LVLVTYLMAKSFSGDKKIASVASIITAANPLVLMSASRSIPDILLTLFLTISAWGFLEILISQKPKKIHYWMAYLGAALAFETKGIPAAAFGGISILFILFNPWKRKSLNQIFEPISLVVSIFVALSWFVVMYFQHGSTYLDSFFADQVGDRVSSKIIQVFTNTFLGVINLVAFLIPWIIIVFSKLKSVKEVISKSLLQTKAVFGFIFSWVVLTLIMAGGVFKFYDRYLLPVIPLIAVFFGFILVNSVANFKTTFLKLLFILNIIALTINIIYAIFINTHPVLVTGIVISLCFIAAKVYGLFKNIQIEIILAGGIMLLYFSGFTLLYPLLMPNPGKQLVYNLNENGISTNEKVYVYGNIRAASNIRIHSENTLQVISMDTVFSLPAGSDHFIVFSEKEKPLLNLENYSVFQGSEEYSSIPLEKLPAFLQKPFTDLKESCNNYFIGKPKNL